MRKIVYFINPISGTRGKAAVLKLIHSETQQQQIVYEVLDTNAAGDYAYLPEKIRAEGITDIVACGGDGTVNQIAAALTSTNVRLGIIPMGSGNGLAFAAHIPRDPYNALQVIFKGNAALIDAFTINNHFSCMLCGLGFDGQVAHDFAQQPQRGVATYVKQILRNFVRSRPYAFSIEAGEKVIYCEAWFISIANSNQYGNHFTIAPRASLSDGLLDVVVVKKMSRFALAWKVLRQVRYGRISPSIEMAFDKKSIPYFHTSTLRIHNPGLAPLHIDGEPVATAPLFDIRILPASIRLIQP
jgi:diacylglycerol kinase (ATP)